MIKLQSRLKAYQTSKGSIQLSHVTSFSHSAKMLPWMDGQTSFLYIFRNTSREEKNLIPVIHLCLFTAEGKVAVEPYTLPIFLSFLFINQGFLAI